MDCPARESQLPKRDVEKNPFASTALTLCFAMGAFTNGECVKLSGSKTGSSVLTCSSQGKKELGYLPETSSSFLRIVMEALSKQPYFYVCIDIGRRKKSYFQKNKFRQKR